MIVGVILSELGTKPIFHILDKSVCISYSSPPRTSPWSKKMPRCKGLGKANSSGRELPGGRGQRCLLVLTKSGRDRQTPAWVCFRDQREHKNVTKLVKPVLPAWIFLLWLFLALGKEGSNRCCLAGLLWFRSRGICSAVIYGHLGPGCVGFFLVFNERQHCSSPKPSAFPHSTCRVGN